MTAAATAVDAREAITALLALLREAEWHATIWGDYPACPWCGGLDPDRVPPPARRRPEDRGHSSECRLVAALSRYAPCGLANDALTAAATDLLAALERVQSTPMPRDEDGRVWPEDQAAWDAAWNQAAVAIDKARGIVAPAPAVEAAS